MKTQGFAVQGPQTPMGAAGLSTISTPCKCYDARACSISWGPKEPWVPPPLSVARIPLVTFSAIQ